MTDTKKVGTVFDDGSLRPMEQMLSTALDDYKHHTSDELRALIDSQCSLANLRYHISNLRTKLRQRGECTVICEDGGYRKIKYALEN